MRTRKPGHGGSSATERHETAIVCRSGGNTSSDRHSDYIRYNESLEYLADPGQLNENIIESKLAELEQMSTGSGTLHLLTLLRLAELTLFCAGNHAQNGCITEVGDLLFNPRLILIHVKDKPNPIAKERHTPLTVQLGEMAATRKSVVEWLKFNTIIEIKDKPVLPHLIDLLKENACPDRYLNAIEERMSHISDTVSQLAVSGMIDSRDNRQAVDAIQAEDRISRGKSPFQMDRTVFRELGDRIEHIADRLTVSGTSESRR